MLIGIRYNSGNSTLQDILQNHSVGQRVNDRFEGNDSYYRIVGLFDRTPHYGICNTKSSFAIVCWQCNHIWYPDWDEVDTENKLANYLVRLMGLNV